MKQMLTRHLNGQVAPVATGLYRSPSSSERLTRLQIPAACACSALVVHGDRAGGTTNSGKGRIALYISSARNVGTCLAPSHQHILLFCFPDQPSTRVALQHATNSGRRGRSGRSGSYVVAPKDSGIAAIQPHVRSDSGSWGVCVCLCIWCGCGCLCD